jgi:hypothetical protein
MALLTSLPGTSGEASPDKDEIWRWAKQLLDQGTEWRRVDDHAQTFMQALNAARGRPGSRRRGPKLEQSATLDVTASDQGSASGRRLVSRRTQRAM